MAAAQPVAHSRSLRSLCRSGPPAWKGGDRGRIQPHRFAVKVRLALLAGPFWDEARGLFNQKVRANFLACERG